jgi:hypothetical protein
MSRRPRPLAVALVVVSSLALGATATTAGASVARAKAPVCKGKTKKKAIKAIKAVWSQVLDYDAAKTADTRFEGIENAEDPEFRAVLDAILAKNVSFLPTITTQINDVNCQGKKEAEVLYDLVISDVPSPGLAGPGTAVLVGKQWKFSDNTVCDLFSLADPSLVESGPCADIALEG